MKKVLFLVFLFSKMLLANNSMEATGYGNSENEALKSAYQNAVEQYVGVLVDTKTVIQNSQLIQNDILTFSNGYIDSYKKISSKEQLGLWEVKIEAFIKKQEILTKIKTLKIEPKQVNDSEQLYAKVTTQVKSKFDAEDMIVKLVQDTSQENVFYRYINLKIDSLNIDIEAATRTTVPVEIKYSVIVNLEEYLNVTNKFEALFKRIGGVVEESNKINPDHYSWIRLRSGEKKDLVIPIVSIKNSELIVDMWRFPKSYDNIYPLVPFKQECNRIWSLLLREEKLYTVYNSTYIDKNPKNVDYEKYNCFHGYKSEVVKVPHIKLSMIDNENKAVWNSDKIDSGVKYDQMFQSWDQEHGTASRFEIAGRENERMLNALKIYELDIKKHGKYTVEDYLVLVEKKVNFMMPIDKIKNLKQVKIEWIQK